MTIKRRKMKVCLLLCAGVHIYAMEKHENERAQQKNFLEPVETEEQREHRLEKFREAMYEAYEEELMREREKMLRQKMLYPGDPVFSAVGSWFVLTEQRREVQKKAEKK